MLRLLVVFVLASALVLAAGAEARPDAFRPRLCGSITVRKGGNDYSYRLKVFVAPGRMHDGAEGHERLHHAGCGPAPLVLPLRPFGRPLGSGLRAHRLWEPDRARVPDRRMSTQLRPASSLSPGERVDLFNAAYADYFSPFRLDEAALDAMTTNFDLDVDASRVALRDGEPVGFGNLGLRGDQAWIGGVGVVVPARRQGIAEALTRALHDEAAARGVTNIWLEVMEQNDPAYRLYAKLGYRIVREVEVWSLPAGPSNGRSE